MRAFALSILIWTSVAFPKSVYKIDPVTDGVITGMGTLAVLVSYAVPVRQRCPCDPNEVNRFDRDAIGNRSQAATILSDVTVGLATVGVAALDAWDQGFTKTLYEDVFVLAETLAVNGALVSGVKLLAQRPIPRVYSGDETDGYRSFYSGHTSTAFAGLMAAAMTAHYRYGWGAWPFVVAGALGTSVAVERVLGGWHFTSDVLVGAVAGTVVGIAVPYFHRRFKEGAEALGVVPLDSGAKLVWARRL